MRLLICCLTLWLPAGAFEDSPKAAKPAGFPVPLRTGEILRVEEVAQDKNMFVFVDVSGSITAVSKDLVDWYRTYYSFPAMYELYCPEESKSEVQRRMQREKADRDQARKQRRTINLTTSDLKKMEPFKYQELFADIKEKQKKTRDVQSKTKTKKKKDTRKIIRTISHGNPVSFKDHLEEGRYVIFDFYADWCGPCRRLGPMMEQLVTDFPGHVALKKIDIKTWGTPVAAQHGIRSIPHVVLYDPEGKKVGGVSARNVDSYLRGKANSANW